MHTVDINGERANLMSARTIPCACARQVSRATVRSRRSVPDRVPSAQSAVARLGQFRGDQCAELWYVVADVAAEALVVVGAVQSAALQQ